MEQIIIHREDDQIIRETRTPVANGFFVKRERLAYTVWTKDPRRDVYVVHGKMIDLDEPVLLSEGFETPKLMVLEGQGGSYRQDDTFLYCALFILFIAILSHL